MCQTCLLYVQILYKSVYAFVRKRLGMYIYTQYIILKAVLLTASFYCKCFSFDRPPVCRQEGGSVCQLSHLEGHRLHHHLRVRQLPVCVHEAGGGRRAAGGRHVAVRAR